VVDELAGAVGPLRRWLPLHAQRDESRSLGALAGTLQRSLDQAREHEFGFDPGAPASAPALAFDCLARPLAHGLTLTYLHAFDGPHLLSCLSFDDGERLSLSLVHDQARVPADAAARWAAALTGWLEVLAAAADRPLASLPLVPEVAQDAVLGGPWPDRAPPPSFLDRFAAAARRDPQAIALVSAAGTRTYRELAERSRRLARALRADGLRPEQPVAVVLSRRPEVVEALLAILQAGGAILPLDPALPTEALAHRLRDAGARIVVTERAHAARIPDGPARLLVDDGRWASLPCDDLPAPRPAQLAYVLYTSGSSGAPKAVAVTHANLAGYVESAAERLGLRAAADFAHCSTLAADLGHTGLFLPLASGGAVHLLDEESMASASALAASLARHPVDYMKIAPSHLRVLLATAAEGRAILPRRGLILGGEALAFELADALAALVPRVFNHYGPTETTVGSAMHAFDPAAARHGDTVPLGAALAGERLYVLDGRLAPLPAGVAGELFISGRGVARGYLGHAALTADRFLPDPFGEPGARMYRTGDRVCRLPDGAIQFLGRTDLQFKVRGFRIEPGEIEAALALHPDVSRAVVVKWTRATDERLVAYVVPARGQRPDPGELRRFAASRLAPQLCPSSYVLLRALPVTANGKLDRAALPEPDADRPELVTRFVAPASEAEIEIAAIWCELLGVSRVGVDDNFFDLGGHSLLLVQLLSRLRARFQCQLGVVELFQHSTVRALARRITSSDAHSGEQLAEAGERAASRARSRARGAERRAAARTEQTGERRGGSR
jgi:amino acid adenylation domain-containing protein